MFIARSPDKVKHRSVSVCRPAARPPGHIGAGHALAATRSLPPPTSSSSSLFAKRVEGGRSLAVYTLNDNAI